MTEGRAILATLWSEEMTAMQPAFQRVQDSTEEGRRFYAEHGYYTEEHERAHRDALEEFAKSSLGLATSDRRDFLPILYVTGTDPDSDALARDRIYRTAVRFFYGGVTDETLDVTVGLTQWPMIVNN